MSQQFQPGDLVSRIADNKKMMVDGYEAGKVVCSWKEDGEERSASFDESGLKEWTEGGKPLGVCAERDMIFVVPLGNNLLRKLHGKCFYSEGFLDRIEGADIPHTYGDTGMNVIFSAFFPNVNKIESYEYQNGTLVGQVDIPGEPIFVD